MSTVHTEIILKNALDVGNAKNGIIEPQKIRQITVEAVVDTGAWTLVINEDTRNKLGLWKIGTDTGKLADGRKSEYDIAGPLEVIWNDRRTNCDALVLPDADEILLGAIPLEAMDLVVHPRTEQVVGAHGDQPLHRIKQYSKQEETKWPLKSNPYSPRRLKTKK